MVKKTCESCKYYTVKDGVGVINYIAWCVKHKRGTDMNFCCDDFDDSVNCYDCGKRYKYHYDVDDIEHYCKETGRLIYQQLKSDLYKGDFEEDRIVKNTCSKMK